MLYALEKSIGLGLPLSLVFVSGWLFNGSAACYEYRKVVVAGGSVLDDYSVLPYNSICFRASTLN